VIWDIQSLFSYLNTQEYCMTHLPTLRACLNTVHQ